MAVEYLTAVEKQLLLDLLFDVTSSFGSAEKRFKEIFSPSRHYAVACELKLLCRDFIISVDGVALIMSIYLADMMRRNDNFAAKALFFDIFVELESAIRRDMFYAEKYKYSSKDVKETKKSVEATYAEVYRIHTTGKVFSFQLLTGSVFADEKPSAHLSKKQEEIDNLLDSCDKSSTLIKEVLAGVTQCWVSEREKQQCSATLKCATTFNQQLGERTVLLVKPTLPKIASLPILTGELQLLLPEHSSMLLVDDSLLLSSESVKKAAETVAKGPISESDQDTFLQSLTEQEARYIGLYTSLLCGMAEHNPSVCIKVLEKICQPTLNFCMQSVINSNVRRESIEQVLLHTSNSLSQTNINTFIAKSLEEIYDKCSLGVDGKQDVRWLILVLEKLYAKGSKENKGICIADPLKRNIERLISRTDDPCLATMWEEMIR